MPIKVRYESKHISLLLDSMTPCVLNFLFYCNLNKKDPIRRKINSKKMLICRISIIIFICQKLESVRPVKQKIKLPSLNSIYSFHCKHKSVNTNKFGFPSKH